MDLLTIHDGRLVVQRPDGSMSHLQTWDDVLRVVKAPGADVSASSSLDFPEEYTQDPTVIGFCHALRGYTGDRQ